MIALLLAAMLDHTEVSNAAYRECVKAGACRPAAFEDPKSAANLKTGKSENAAAYKSVAGDDQPAVGVSWNDARAYCAFRKQRLPTEAEWKKAAGPRRKPSCDWAVYKDCGKPPAAVDSMPESASPSGALHLLGNAAEWMADEAKGGKRIVRGGSWKSTADELRRRELWEPEARFPFIGFRCAR